MLCLASAGLVFIMGWLYMKYSEWYHLIFIVGATCWLAGNVLILTGDYYFFSAPWWMLFFLFTITAERMELARFVLLQKSRINLLTSFLGLSFISLLVPFHAGGKLLLGLSFALVCSDSIYPNVMTGQERFHWLNFIQIATMVRV